MVAATHEYWRAIAFAVAMLTVVLLGGPAHSAVPATGIAGESGQQLGVAVVDTRVVDYQALAEGAREAGLEVILLGSGNGIADLAEALKGRGDIDALHILSHGDTGRVFLGNDVLSAETLDKHTGVLAVIANSLSIGGDLLLYGCNVAAGAEGEAFVISLAAATSADVAASTSLVGAADLGGNWSLEYETGSIEAAVFSAETMAGYGGVLGTLPDGVQDFTGYDVDPVDGWKMYSPDGFFTLTAESGTGEGSLNADDYGAYIEDSSPGEGATSYFQLAATGDLGSFILDAVEVGTYDNGGPAHFTAVQIIGYVAGGQVAATEPYTSPAGEQKPNFDIDYSPFENVPIDTFRVYYTTEGDTRQTEFNLAGFTIGEASAEPPPPPNAAPVITLPATPAVHENASDVVITGISVADADGDSQAVTLTASGGTFTVGTTTGLTLDSGSYTHGVSVEFSGALTAVNNALASLTFTPTADFHGTATLQVQSDDGQGGVDDKILHITVHEAPRVVSIVRADGAAQHTNADSLGFDVSFSADVTGVAASDFQVTGGATGVDIAVTQLTASTYRVTLSGGDLASFDGSVGLNLVDDDSITSTATSTPLGGVGTTGAGDGSFSAGETYILDNTAPTVTPGNIAVTGGSGTDGAYIIGDTVTVTWNNTTGGDNNGDVASVTVDFGQFGGGSVVASNLGDTWSATYTIVAGALNGVPDRNVILIATDHVGNVTAVSDTSNATVDNVRPSFTAGPTASNIGGSGFDLAAAISEVGSLSYVVVARGAIAPTSEQVAAGVDYGVTVLAADSQTLSIAPLTHTFAVSGLDVATEYDVYVVARDAASNLMAAPSKVEVTTLAAPTVVSITRTGDELSNAETVGYEVTFSEEVTGVAVGDFSLTTTGDIAGATVAEVTGSGASRTVTVATGTGDGSIRLDLNDDDSITATGSGVPLGGMGAGNGDFTDGEIYTIDRTPPAITAVSIPDAGMKVNDTVIVTIIVEADPDQYTLVSGSIGGFPLGSLSKTSDTSYSAEFTVTEGGTDVAAEIDIPVSLVLRDSAGNENTAHTTPISQPNDPINANSPTDIALTPASIGAAATGADAEVGTLSATDATPGDTFSYALVAGAGDTDNGLFNISGNSLRTSASLGEGAYSLRVQVADAGGNVFAKAFTVEVLANQPPVNDAPPIVSGGPRVGDLFTVSTGDWSDPEGDGISYSYQWQRADDASGTNIADIHDAIANTYQATGDDAHQYLRAAVTATDDPGGSTTAHSAWVAVENTPPVLGGSFTTNGEVDDNATIAPFEGVTVTDTDGDEVSLRIEYTAANGTLQGTGLAGEAGDYTLGAADPATLSTRLQALTFIPTENQVAPDSLVVTAFTLTPNDGRDDGTSNSATRITARSINDAPELDLDPGEPGSPGFAVDFVPEGDPVALASENATVTDVDVDARIHSLTVVIDATPNGARESLELSDDAQAVAGDNSLAVSYDAGTRSLTVSGTADPEVYQTILRGVRYANMAGFAEIDFTARVVNIRANDGEADSVAVTSTIAIVSAPIVDLDPPAEGSDIEHVYTEGDDWQAITPQAVLTEPEGLDLTEMAIILTNAQDAGEEMIRLDGRESGEAVTGITITYDSETEIILTGTASAADYQALLRELQYRHSGSGPEEDTVRALTVRATNANDHAGNTATARISVVNVNNAPVLTDTAPDLGSLAGQTSQAFQIATFLSATDADRDPEFGIAIIAHTGTGTWEYSTDGGGTWAALGSVSETQALLLRDDHHLRYARTDGNAETATLGFRAWDRTTGTAGEQGDASDNGGTTAYSADTGTASLSTELLQYTVQASAGSGGGVTPSQAEVTFGLTQSFTVSPNSGHNRSSSVGGTCPIGSWSGDTWTTGAINDDCSVSFGFTAAPPPSPEPVPPPPEPAPPEPEDIVFDDTTRCAGVLAAGCHEQRNPDGSTTVEYNEIVDGSTIEIVVDSHHSDPDAAVTHTLTRTQPDGSTVTTRATSELPGSTTRIEPDAEGYPQVVTRAEGPDGTGYEVTARHDGTAVHRVIRPDGTVTEAVSGLPGAQTVIDTQGRVVTTVEATETVFENGEPVVRWVRATVVTQADGHGETRYELYDEQTGSWRFHASTLDSTLANNHFDPGHQVVIEQGENGLQVRIVTSVSQRLYF